MENDIEPGLGSDQNAINISKIGKYDKFIDFKIFKSQDSEIKIEYPRNAFFLFTTNKMLSKKLKESDCFLAMANMQTYLDDKIEEELKENLKLQEKILKIEKKAQKRIDKLKERPKKKLQEKYFYSRIEEYFKPKISEESSSSSPQDEPSP